MTVTAPLSVRFAVAVIIFSRFGVIAFSVGALLSLTAPTNAWLIFAILAVLAGVCVFAIKASYAYMQFWMRKNGAVRISNSN